MDSYFITCGNIQDAFPGGFALNFMFRQEIARWNRTWHLRCYSKPFNLQYFLVLRLQRAGTGVWPLA